MAIKDGETSSSGQSFFSLRIQNDEPIATSGISSEIRMLREDKDSRELSAHLDLLQTSEEDSDLQELALTPIFTAAALRYAKELASGRKREIFPQYGLIAGMGNMIQSTSHVQGKPLAQGDPRLFFNVTTPSSTFICGSQGSGKSHTLSCLLENCLIPSVANKLPKNLTGLVFHYDTFISDDGGSPCEAAFLSSDPQIKVRVLCAPTNLATIKASIEQSQSHLS
jgi:hypothetical protein